MLFIFARTFSFGFNFIGLIYALSYNNVNKQNLLDLAEADDVKSAIWCEKLLQDTFVKKNKNQPNIKVGDRITWFINDVSQQNRLSFIGKIISKIINIVDANHIILNKNERNTTT